MAHQLPETSIMDEKLPTLFEDLYTGGTIIKQQQQSLAMNRISSVKVSPTIIPGLAEEEEYRPRTLGAHNIARLSILPIFPSFSPSTKGTQPHLLLSNVPIHLLTKPQYARIKYHAFPALFRLEMNISANLNAEKNPWSSSCQSFLLCLYQELYTKIKKRLKIDIPIIDCNFMRLHHCIDKVVVQRCHHGRLQQQQQPPMLNMDELCLALEFYLQFDVDMFYLKTCCFNGVKPRLFEHRFREGLFCIDPPEARYSIVPCYHKYCPCCHPSHLRQQYPNNTQQQRTSIPFTTPHIHRFVNQYAAILNCPATCQTKNCIYVLTCPCGQFDFVGLSNLSFTETLAYHRAEGNRIIREFLIGEQNIHYITDGLKSDEKIANDQMWLYQHSTWCSTALQLFLDLNPDYWCFVPMKSLDMNKVNQTIHRSSGHLASHTSLENASLTLSSVRTRTNDEVHRLINNLAKPPLGFDFSVQQRQQQKHFFRCFQDYIVPRDNVDLYNANITAVLPERCSKLFGQLIESLFITNAECKLNEIGHLDYEYFDPNHGLHTSWCANLTHRSV